MKILLAHTSYQQPGGEDAVFQAEKELLELNGHTIIPYQRSNHESGAASDAIWSQKTYRELQALIRRTNPRLAHFHNTFLAISPSAYHACHDAGVPVIQTLHNFRLICPGALLLRNGKPCEDCIKQKLPWPGVLHACWRGSRTGSALTAALIGFHHATGTWHNKVDRYIALSEFSRQKFIMAGFAASKIVVKPNFSADPGIEQRTDGEYALFVGRLSQEKGLNILLTAWQNLPDIPLKIVGNGPLLRNIQETMKKNQLNQVELLGKLERDSVLKIMKKARYLIIPSICYENLPLTLVEAFSLGLPVIATGLGSLENLVSNRHTGLHFRAGETQDLANKCTWLWQNPQEAKRMGQNARYEYEEKYTPQENYRQLMAIYHQVLEESHSRSI